MQQGLMTMARRRYRYRSRLKQLLLDRSAQGGEPISQRQLAKDTGIALSTVSRWYRDDDLGSIDPDTLGVLLTYFGVPFDEMVAIEPVDENDNA